MKSQQDLQIENKSMDHILTDSLLRTKNMFIHNINQQVLFQSQINDLQETTKNKLKVKIHDEYKHIYEKETDKISIDKMTFNVEKKARKEKDSEAIETELTSIIEEIPQEKDDKISMIPQSFLKQKQEPTQELDIYGSKNIGTIMQNKMKKLVKPDWHPQWKLMRVISGHLGWVRAIAVDPSNNFFVSGSNDRTIKFWDMASGDLKITLTGHINTIRGLCVSPKYTYLYSCSEDKTVKCWDLEYNKIIRNYHGHLSGVYCIAQHPTLDLIFSGGRDATVRVWDIRTRNEVHCLSGHQNVVASVQSQEFEPQVISGSHDNTVKCWDLAMGKCVKTLTNHKKGIRALAIHPEEYTFASAAADNVKIWKCPDGEFLRNASGHKAIINCMDVNSSNVMVTGADDGSMNFWDWKSGYNFQKIQSQVQPGSISAEGGIFASAFDKSGIRLITGECDKTIKIWKEDENSTPQTHPVDNIRMEFNQNY